MSGKHRFYVYEWFNTDTDEVFYVGKGSGNRYKIKNGRNKYFLNYCNKYKCKSRKIKEGLTEEEAFELEIKTIREYRLIGQCQCNLSNGGEGSTFPEGSWNQLFKSLQYTHTIANNTRDMYDEEDYDTDNLKKSSTKELQELYDNYQDYKENRSFCREMEIKTEEQLTAYELDMKNSEIYQLTKLIAKDVAIKYEEFNEYLDIKNEVDFYCVGFDWDKFIEKIISEGGKLFTTCFVESCRYHLRFLRRIGDKNVFNDKNNIKNNNRINVAMNVQSFNLKDDGFWHIKFNDDQCKKMNRVKIDMRDIIMGLLIEKEKTPLYGLFHREICCAEIYK